MLGNDVGIDGIWIAVNLADQDIALTLGNVTATAIGATVGGVTVLVYPLASIEVYSIEGVVAEVTPYYSTTPDPLEPPIYPPNGFWS